MSEFVVKVPSVLKKEVPRLQKEVESMICAEEKAALLSSYLDEAMKGAKQLREEEITDWAVKLQRSSRRGRFDELEKKGLI
jgi:hypothetical protein